MANPLLTAQPILFVVRPQYLPDHHNTETMFQTGEINTGSFRGPGAMKIIDFARGGRTTKIHAAANQAGKPIAGPPATPEEQDVKEETR